MPEDALAGYLRDGSQLRTRGRLLGGRLRTRAGDGNRTRVLSLGILTGRLPANVGEQHAPLNRGARTSANECGRRRPRDARGMESGAQRHLRVEVARDELRPVVIGRADDPSKPRVHEITATPASANPRVVRRRPLLRVRNRLPSARCRPHRNTCRVAPRRGRAGDEGKVVCRAPMQRSSGRWSSSRSSRVDG